MRRHHFLLLLLLLAACAEPATPPGGENPSSDSLATSNTFETTGVVRRLEAGRGLIVIAHDEVPGLMGPMTMPFELRDSTIIADIAVDDSIIFTFERKPEGGALVTRIEKRGP